MAASGDDNVFERLELAQANYELAKILRDTEIACAEEAEAKAKASHILEQEFRRVNQDPASRIQSEQLFLDDAQDLQEHNNALLAVQMD